MIPKIIHQIWIQGIDHLPEELRIKHQLIKSSNPSYEVKLWDDKSLQNLLSNHYPVLHRFYMDADNIPGFGNPMALRSDLGRFGLLAQYGGFYIDMDFYSSIDLEKLMKDYTDSDMIFADNSLDILKPLENIIYTPIYNTAFCAFKPQHPIWNDIFETMKQFTTKPEIVTAVDEFLQKSNIRPTIFPSHIVSTHTSCNINPQCFTPRSSSWFSFRPALCWMSCSIRWIILFLIILVAMLLYIFTSR
jgi:mannosyltransferase OCH1-like enzyme